MLESEINKCTRGQSNAVENNDVEDLDEAVAMFISFENSEKKEALYKGQYVHTAYGRGSISSLHPKRGAIVFKLPFGTLYADLRQYVVWGQQLSSSRHSAIASMDPISDAALKHNWQQIGRYLDIPVHIKTAIQRTLNGYNAVSGGIPNSNANNDHIPMDISRSDGSGHVGALPCGCNTSADCTHHTASSLHTFYQPTAIERADNPASTSIGAALLATGNNSAILVQEQEQSSLAQLSCLADSALLLASSAGLPISPTPLAQATAPTSELLSAEATLLPLCKDLHTTVLTPPGNLPSWLVGWLYWLDTGISFRLYLKTVLDY